MDGYEVIENIARLHVTTVKKKLDKVNADLFAPIPWDLENKAKTMDSKSGENRFY